MSPKSWGYKNQYFPVADLLLCWVCTVLSGDIAEHWGPSGMKVFFPSTIITLQCFCKLVDVPLCNSILDEQSFFGIKV